MRPPDRSRRRRRVQQVSLSLLASLAFASASGFSSMGTALVTQSGDQPCFGVPGEGSTREAPPRLYSLSITPAQAARSDWRALPEELWGFNVAPPGLRLEGVPPACIRYGELPAAAQARVAPSPLEPGRMYHVEMSARPADGRERTRAYKVDFCLVPMTNGAPELRVVTWDEDARRWRDEVCATR